MVPRRPLMMFHSLSRQGEIAAFIGPNGAGKSTMMRIITGFLAADSGEVSCLRSAHGPGDDGGKASYRLPA